MPQDWPRTCYEAKAGSELLILLPPPLPGYRHHSCPTTSILDLLTHCGPSSPLKQQCCPNHLDIKGLCTHEANYCHFPLWQGQPAYLMALRGRVRPYLKEERRGVGFA